MKQRVRIQVQLDDELMYQQNQILGTEQLSEILHRQLIESFVNEMLCNRLQDLKTESVVGPDGCSNLQMKMELFVFNKEELKDLVAMIKNGIEII